MKRFATMIGFGMLSVLLFLAVCSVGFFLFWKWFTSVSPEENVVIPTPASVTWLDTGLSPADQSVWHHLSEGSELMPISVLEALKSPRTKKPFLYSLSAYGFMVESPDPHSLPVGWTTETRSLGGRQVPFIGINCAGCHTGEWTYKGRTVRIDGAPNMFALEEFFDELRDALKQTHQEKLGMFRFVRDVIRLDHNGARGMSLHDHSEDASHPTTETNLAAAHPVDGATNSPTAGTAEEVLQPGDEILKARAEAAPEPTEGTKRDLLQLVADIDDMVDLLRRRLRNVTILANAIDSGVPLGPGRGDSFGIIRQLLWPYDPIQLDAPVSTPHLFNFKSFKWVHWDGNTQSVMQRNIAQAIALGADYNPASRETSVKPLNLHELEKVGRKIKPPAWPEKEFGAIDHSLAARGGVLYREHCARCHSEEKIHSLREVKTDPIRANNFVVPIAGLPFAKELGAFAAKTELVCWQQNGIGEGQRSEFEFEKPRWRGMRGYVARSLAGVWATAPYLHNGSVPTLWDLLQAPEKRPKKFWVGSREFDPKKLGITEPPIGSDGKVFDDLNGPKMFSLDTTLRGNGNEGHSYGVQLPEADKWAMIEYIKTITE